MRYSVIVPCYHTAGTLARTVESIQKSGINDYEILLIDDGSADETPALCDRLEKENTNIRVFHQPNAGVSAARNRGIEAADGEYIWFFDSDDLVDEGSMKRAAEIIEDCKPDMLMFGMSFDSYAGKRIYQRLELYYDKERLMTPVQAQEAFAELYHNNMLTPCWNKLFRRDLLIRQGVRFHPDLFVMEDFHFSLLALQSCETVYTLPQVIYRYRQSDSLGENRAAKRVNRVKDLPAYMAHFEPMLAEHQDILATVFFMLLRQKLSVQSPREMAETAKTVCDSPYMLLSGSDEPFVRKLRDGDFQALYNQFQRTEVRRRIVSLIKRSILYSWVKGFHARRVVW